MLLEINLRITQINKVLVGNSIQSLSEIIMSEKGLKKIDIAKKKFEKGNDLLGQGDYSKALEKYKMAWDQIKKALKDPHFI